MMKRIELRIIGLFFVGVTIGSGNVAWSTPIDVGIDEFHTLPGTFATLPPEAGGAILNLRSRPISCNGCDTDTIVRRLDPLPGLNVGGAGTTRIQITALSLESVSPVGIGGSFFDVFVTLDPAVTQRIGAMTISQTTSDGGTFNANLPVDARLFFTQVGNPSNMFNLPFPHIEFTSETGTWSFTPLPFYPVGIGGGFNPTSPSLRECTTPGCINAAVVHIVRPEMVPEPSTLLLLGSGLAGIAAFGRKRLAKKG